MRFRKKKHTWIPLEEPREDEGGSYRESGAPDSNLSDLLDRLDLQSAAVANNHFETRVTRPKN
jgi:hypothetical protein